jgi:hypothetical protein
MVMPFVSSGVPARCYNLVVSMRRFLVLIAIGAGMASGCAHPQPKPAAEVMATPPPKDDGKAANAQVGAGGTEHAAALEQLKIAAMGAHIDKQSSLEIDLPDPDHWMRVRFWNVESLVGFRYGKDHHAIVGGFVTHVPDNKAQSACSKSFEEYARPYIEAFDVEITQEEPSAFLWQPATKAKDKDRDKQIVEVEVVHAKVATLLAHDEFAAAFASYPVWGSNACLVVGIAVPQRGEPERANAVRDRFVKEVFPKLRVTRADEPKERY